MTNKNNKIKERITEFKIKCTVYLQEKSLGELRAYGRYIGLQRPTALPKKELIDTIVKTLCGEVLPARTSKGAPVKSNHLDPSILADIDEIKRECGIDDDRIVWSDLPNASVTAQTTKKIPDKNENGTPSLQVVLRLDDLTEQQKEKLAEFFHSL